MTQAQYKDPYKSKGYQAWVRAGNCPAISLGKAWCGGLNNHAGDHWSPRYNGKTHDYEREYWTQVLPRSEDPGAQEVGKFTEVTQQPGTRPVNYRGRGG